MLSAFATSESFLEIAVIFLSFLLLYDLVKRRAGQVSLTRIGGFWSPFSNILKVLLNTK